MTSHPLRDAHQGPQVHQRTIERESELGPASRTTSLRSTPKAGSLPLNVGNRALRRLADSATTASRLPSDPRLVGIAIHARRREIIQAKYQWSAVGDDGVLLGTNDERFVFKFGGYDDYAVPLDQLAGRFGFRITNAEVVASDDATVVKALEDVNDADPKTKAARTKERVLKMERLPGSPLHEADLSGDRGKTEKVYNDLGRMVVMDLVTRNNDRFDLRKFDDRLLATATEQKMDSDDWRPWMANEGNVIIDEETGAANPIDSQFTEAGDEQMYAANVARILTEKQPFDDLVDAVYDFVRYGGLSGVAEFDEIEAKRFIREGIESGRTRLLNLD